jgi:hypothetical protein
MQREIEFRFWSKDRSEMSSGFCLQEMGNEQLQDELNKGELEIMQFTGLLDKNGKKIFESDILKIYYEGNQRSYLKEVKWLNDAINKGRWDALDNCVYTSCEVVGNIFENPELLEANAKI